MWVTLWLCMLITCLIPINNSFITKLFFMYVNNCTLCVKPLLLQPLEYIWNREEILQTLDDTVWKVILGIIPPSRKMRFLRFLALKVLRKAQNATFPGTFLILDNFCCMTYPQKMPLSTLKLQFLDSQIPQFSKSGNFESLKMPQNQSFLPKSKLGGHHTYVTGIYVKLKHW